MSVESYSGLFISYLAYFYARGKVIITSEWNNYNLNVSVLNILTIIHIVGLTERMIVKSIEFFVLRIRQVEE